MSLNMNDPSSHRIEGAPPSVPPKSMDEEVELLLKELQSEMTSSNAVVSKSAETEKTVDPAQIFNKSSDPQIPEKARTLSEINAIAEGLESVNLEQEETPQVSHSKEEEAALEALLENLSKKEIQSASLSKEEEQDLLGLLGELGKEVPKSHYEKDKEIIENMLKESGYKSIKEYANAKLQGIDLQKFSRREFTDLTHSYILTPQGKLIQQVHKSSIPEYPHQLQDTQEGFIGQGGAKIVSRMLNEKGETTHVRSVVYNEAFDIQGGIEAVSAFKNNKYLEVGHFMEYQTVNKSGKPVIKQVFIFNYMKDGDLDDKTLPLHQAIDVSLQVGLGLQSVHKKGWAHLDIKPANILIRKEGNDKIRAKLSDFDLAKNFNTEAEDVSILVGSPDYVSPEMLQGNCFGKEGGQKNDVFAFGLSMLEIAGFSVYDNSYKKDPSLATLPEEEQRLKLDQARANFSYDAIRDDFNDFKKNLTPSPTPRQLEFLNLAYAMINPDPDARPKINSIVAKLKSLSRA